MIDETLGLAGVPPMLLDALNGLNWTYGRGDIVAVEYTYCGSDEHIIWGEGFAVCKLQYGENRAKFRIIEGTLYFRGHQRKLKAI